VSWILIPSGGEFEIMHFIYNERKAAQMAAQFTKMAGGTINYLLLIKLMYLADRLHLVNKGRPITGDEFYSLRLGPILSRTLDLIRDVPRSRNSPWFQYISPPSDCRVSLVNPDPEDDEFSTAEMRTIRQTFQQYGHYDPFVLADLTHQILPEWRDPGDSCLRISPEEILRQEGKPEAEIKAISDESTVALTLASIKSFPISPKERDNGTRV